MVTFVAQVGAWGLLLAEKPLLQRLDPDTRARVLGVLGGLILLGFLLVALVWLGGAGHSAVHPPGRTDQRAADP